MKILHQSFLVRIDKQAQGNKRSMSGSIYIPENHQDMRYNLQYGEVVGIAEKAGLAFPEVELGDILLFSHLVEYKPRTTGDLTYSDNHLVETADNLDEIRTANVNHEVFGVIKTDTGELIPYRGFIFCHEEFKEAGFQISESGLYLPNKWDESEQAMTEKLEELKEQLDNIQKSIQFKNPQENKHVVDQLQKEMSKINNERKAISQKMNKEKYVELTCLFVNPASTEKWGPWGRDLDAGDKVYAHSWALYPLDISGAHYTVVNIEYIALIKTKHMNKSMPIHDRVLVLQDKQEKETEGGILIPETVDAKPRTGIVYDIGPGKEDEDTFVRKNDQVAFGKHTGTEIEMDGHKLLLMRESDILYTTL